jgi:hypothetical protein
MTKKTKRPPPAIRWEFPRHVPTVDFFEGMHLDDDPSEAIEVFIGSMEYGTFLIWEAVVSREQGLRLTQRQEEALGELVGWGRSRNKKIHYIDELARPSEPWYVILNRIVPHLLVEPFRTFKVHWEITSEGWGRLVECLEEHAGGLSLPAGAKEPLDVVTPDLRHKLTLQSCFTILEGLGQDEVPPLEECRYRIDEFIDRLRRCKESVGYFDLTLDSLFKRVILPDRDGELLVKTMMGVLGIKSTQDRIADHL